MANAFVSWLLGKPSASVSAGAPALAAPGSGSSLAQAIVGDIIGHLPTEAITRDNAPRVPELKRALKAHQALVAPIRFEQWKPGGDAPIPAQPYWVASCAYPGMSRYIAYKKLVEELFWEGFGVLACRLDVNGNVWDWVPVPRHMWTMDNQTQAITLHEAIPAEYRMRIVVVPLGANGVMVDGVDSIRQARKLEAARQSRLDTPPAATELHVTDPAYNGMTKPEMETLATNYSEVRKTTSVSVTPSFIEVKERGISGQLDLFESAKNSLRLELAMHGGVPASFVEGGKEGGANGEMNYQGKGGPTAELWTFGSAEYARAIAAALSGDDVVGPGAEVRADLSHISAPAPTSIDPEAGDTGNPTTEEN
ncbi:hypothetical protein [uncultured Microbacterium sp.]|uniref:hypothetical protein n=1 Tax=uncultured Microbacterium sp. TaxID=191216 RepID=UPI0025E22A4B|nr:hypothetical protein [uncultured Microbacterium sp.]